MTSPRILLVVKTTTYETYVEREEHARTVELLRANDPAVERLIIAHEAHEETEREALDAIAALGATVTRMTTAEAHKLVHRDGADFDLIVTVGGDGTLLAASHGVGTTPILGVNSAPEHSVGFFCGANKGKVRAALAAALGGKMRRTILSRMEVVLNGISLSRRVLNDVLFCHEVAAATSRYILTVDNGRTKREEEQKSSGLWVGPPAGSTAAQRSAGGKILPLRSRKLQYVVREPYTPTRHGEERRLVLARGVVGENGSVTLRSKMHDAKLFVDGPHVAYSVGIGDVVCLRLSSEPLTVLGLSPQR